MRRPAFTLIELIVTIMIIAILMAIALPFLKGARETAKRAACMVNLKSLATATEQYRSKQAGELPWSTRRTNIAVGHRAPLDEIALYLDTSAPGTVGPDALPSAPWRCPSDAEIAVQTGWSYVYLPTDIMNYFEFRSSAAGRQATRYFDEHPESPIFAEGTSFHDPSGTGRRRLVATLDGAVSEQ